MIPGSPLHLAFLVPPIDKVQVGEAHHFPDSIDVSSPQGLSCTPSPQLPRVTDVNQEQQMQIKKSHGQMWQFGFQKPTWSGSALLPPAPLVSWSRFPSRS